MRAFSVGVGAWFMFTVCAVMPPLWLMLMIEIFSFFLAMQSPGLDAEVIEDSYDGCNKPNDATDVDPGLGFCPRRGCLRTNLPTGDGNVFGRYAAFLVMARNSIGHSGSPNA